MWSKSGGPEFYPSMFRLTHDQRWAVQQLIGQMAKDPRDEVMDPIILAGDQRELDVAGVWLRYRIRTKEKRIIFLRVTP